MATLPTPTAVVLWLIRKLIRSSVPNQLRTPWGTPVSSIYRLLGLMTAW